MIQSLKCVISDLDLERSSQGHPQGNHLEAHVISYKCTKNVPLGWGTYEGVNPKHTG